VDTAAVKRKALRRARSIIKKEGYRLVLSEDGWTATVNTIRSKYNFRTATAILWCLLWED
jgi:hypothetical protein